MFEVGWESEGEAIIAIDTKSEKKTVPRPCPSAVGKAGGQDQGREKVSQVHTLQHVQCNVALSSPPRS